MWASKWPVFLYHVARGYTECFNIYGERKSFEWQQLESEKPVLFSMAFDPMRSM